MKTKTKHPLYFTRSERQGIACFALLCTLLFWAPSRFPDWLPPTETDFTAFQQQIAGFTGGDTAGLLSPLTGPADAIDPNTAGEAELAAAGFPARAARMLLNYRSKGGRFRYREDLKKLYAIDEELYEQLAPYIDLPIRPAEQPARPVLVKEPAADRLAPFDPNDATEEQLLQLGLPDRIVSTLINYRSRGGVFRTKEDLLRVYGLTSDWYDRLAPYVQLPEMAGAIVEEAHDPENLDINQSDADAWRRLPGIGPVLSARIVKFRDKLGGFHSVEQVAETYGLPDSTFQRIAGRLVASPIPHPISINRASIEELQEHPYLDWRQAKAIVQYRINHGPLRSLEDFAQIRVLNDVQRAKIAPYLVFD